MKSDIMKSVIAASEKYNRKMLRRGINEDRETHNIKKWRKELNEYNKKNKTDVKFCYENYENHRYAVNRGIHTIEYKREFWKIPNVLQKKNEKLKNEIVLIYGGNIGILKNAQRIEQISSKLYFIKLKDMKKEILCRRSSTLEIEKEIEINNIKYEIRDIAEMLIRENVKVFEIM